MNVPGGLQVLGGTADMRAAKFQLAYDDGLTALACRLKIMAFRVWGAMGNIVLVIAFLGPLLGSAVVPVDVPPITVTVLECT